MRIEHFRDTIKRNPSIALAFAAIVQLLVTLGVFAVGRAGLVPRQFDRDGIGDFASDGHIHKPVMDALVGILKQGQFRSWMSSQDSFHVKLYSLVGIVTEPLVGSNILTIEPLNLICYLLILVLTFRLTKIVSDSRAAWLATLIVALWPSLLLHSTQFLRDPLILIAVLTLMTLLVLVVKEQLNWQRATGAVLAGAAAIYLAWQTRPEMWLLVVSIIFLAALLLLLKFAVTRKIVVANLLAIACVATLSIAMPRPAVGIVSQPLSVDMPAGPPGNATSTPGSVRIWQRVALARDRFIQHGIGAGSVIDDDVRFNSPADIIRYVPRALEIGYFAPFPYLWLGEGGKVGIIGRIISGVEMVLTYFFEFLACLFVWQNRKQFSSWLLLLATMVGMLALGLVITNVGTLYRMRYPFWILLVTMATGAAVQWHKSHASDAAN